MAGRLRSIDSLRGLAACAVVLFHSDDSLTLGAAGVDIFFVVSGFVIAGVLASRPGPDFLLDRAQRIFPLYWLALLPLCAGLLANGQLSASQFAMNALLVPRWFAEAEMLLYLSWTLVFEMLFYTGAALTLRLRSAAPVLAGYFVLLATFAATADPSLRSIGSPIILEFLAGIVIFHARKHPAWGVAAIVAGLALLSCSPGISRGVYEVQSAFGRAFLWGMPCALVVYGTVSIERWLTGRFVTCLCWLGGASYSIYLFHPYGQLVAPDIWWLKLLFGVGFGALVWFVAERRLEALRYALRKRRGTARATPVAFAGDALCQNDSAQAARISTHSTQ